MHSTRLTHSVAPLALLLLCAGTQAQSPIHLRQGTYVERSVRCHDAAFASMKSWDGSGFGGPHSSRCTAKILTRHGNTFRIDDTCTALGDGTPATPDTERATVAVLGTQAFRYVRDVPAGKDVVEYRWCSAD